ncbi:hypothetical protein BC332_02148 [Capsicum chinense]|nr:hypothetical protein BC332_02148 [Capsicum chinense]
MLDQLTFMVRYQTSLTFSSSAQDSAKLSQKFEENILDSTKKFEKLITDKKDIEGLPATTLGLAAQTTGHEVKWVMIMGYG